MEINVTDLISNYMDEPTAYSDSVANSGLSNIGQITWQRALAVEESPLDTPDKLDAALDHFLAYGAWSRSELDDATLRGLLVQEVASAIQHIESFGDCYIQDMTAELFEYYVAEGMFECEGGLLHLGCDDQWYYYLGE